MEILTTILAVIGGAVVLNIFYKAIVEWRREGKDNPQHLDQDTIDRINMESSGEAWWKEKSSGEKE